MKRLLKAGDEVICIDNNYSSSYLAIGNRYTVRAIYADSFHGEHIVYLKGDKNRIGFFEDQFVRLGPIDKFFLKDNYYKFVTIVIVTLVISLQNLLPTTLLITCLRSLFIGLSIGALGQIIFTLYPRWILSHRK